MPYSYPVFFNGVLHAQPGTKAKALEIAHRIVDQSERRCCALSITHPECRDKYERLSRLRGVLATAIPDANKRRTPGRVVLKVGVGGETIMVRRDVY